LNFVHGGLQTGGARKRTQQLPELLRDVGMLDARRGNQVQDALPDLVQAIHASVATALEQARSSGGGAPSTSVDMTKA
jgi:hypothetical protein